MCKLKISVIVAVYKVEQYLRKCVDSILVQTYKNIEIILVDDGSPDLSGSICDEYAVKDPRVIVIHKENGGQSTARNAALDIANGDYIGFIDGDDWIEPEMYQTLLDTMLHENADIVQCGWYRVGADGTKTCPYIEDFEEVYTSNQGLDELIHSSGGHLNTSVCCKLFKGDIARQFRFSPVRAYEDDEYIFKTISVSERIVCINLPFYDYLKRDGSTMTAKFNLNKIALVKIQSNICELLRTRYPERFNEMQKILCSKQFYTLNCLLNADYIPTAKEEAGKMKQTILLSYDEYMKNPLMGKNKLMLQSMKYAPQFVWRTILKLKFA